MTYLGLHPVSLLRKEITLVVSRISLKAVGKGRSTRVC